MQTVPMPGGPPARRTLHFFWLADCSKSMDGQYIQAVNRAVREAIPLIRDAVKPYPATQVRMRAIAFSDAAHWHIGPASVPLEDFEWRDLTADGMTATAAAVNLLAEQLTVELMPRRGLPPVCILLSDGYCTDEPDAYSSAIQRLESEVWGRKAIRLAIGIGSDFAHEELLQFVSHKNIGVLEATDVDQIVKHIKWASISATAAASHGPSRSSSSDSNGGVSVYLSPPPRLTASPTDVF